MNTPFESHMNVDHDHIALVLQGGGALGAYQAGVFEVMARMPREPTWVAGMSIGAINAALIAGNPPARRVERLREFWNLVSSGLAGLAPLIDEQRSAFHRFSSAFAATWGVNGFYHPRGLPPMLQPAGSDAAISLYDTAPLRETLLRLVDFDLINSRAVRLSVGAVNLRSGNSVTFDNALGRIGPEHIMASGALPPAFPPVTIDGESYWDGGIVSNTPLQYVLDQRGPGRILVAQVDLFSARGPMPTTLGQAMARHKDIVYSSRTRFNTDQAARAQRERRAMQRLIAKLTPEQRRDPEVQRLAAAGEPGHVDIVHLIYRQQTHELESKDYEFSRATVLDHWQAGRTDMENTMRHPDWLEKSDPNQGVTVYDLAHDRSPE